MPFIKDIENNSPLDKCFNKKNFKSADVLLFSLKDEPLDSHT